MCGLNCTLLRFTWVKWNTNVVIPHNTCICKFIVNVIFPQHLRYSLQDDTLLKERLGLFCNTSDYAYTKNYVIYWSNTCCIRYQKSMVIEIFYERILTGYTSDIFTSANHTIKLSFMRILDGL